MPGRMSGMDPAAWCQQRGYAGRRRHRLFGNCGFGIAPTSSPDRPIIMRTPKTYQGMPYAV